MRIQIQTLIVRHLLCLSGLLLCHLAPPLAIARTSAITSAPTSSMATEQKIDQLIALVQARLALAIPVAKAKWNSQSPITDSAREAQVMDAFTKAASSKQLREDVARRFIAAQIEASKQVQQALHAQWKKQGLGKFDPAPDLAREVRPQLDQLTPQMIAALLALQDHIGQAGFPAVLKARLQYANGRTPAWGASDMALPAAMASLLP
ncbi:MAG: Periplasmic chorismate mutase precursor [Pseudomonadota bacterium]